MHLKCTFSVCSKTKYLATRVDLLVCACQWLAPAPPLCSVLRSLVRAKSFPHSQDPLTSGFISLEARTAHCFLFIWISIFKKRPCPAPGDGERVLLSIPWTDEVWIRPDIERSFLLKKHANLCTICIRILSNVTPVKIFSNPSGFEKITSVLVYVDVSGYCTVLGACSGGRDALIAFLTSEQGTEPCKPQFPHV